MLCRASKIRGRLDLEPVACVFDQAFYAKAMNESLGNTKICLKM